MEILNQFGFDLRLFGAQIVNFLIIAFIFKRFMYKPLLDTLNKRSKKIKQGLMDAEAASKALEDAEEKKDEIIKKATLEAEKVLEEAKNYAQKTKDEMIENTRKEIERMMETTKEQIELERENFKKEAKNMSLDIAQKVLESVVGNLFDKNEQEVILKKGLQKIKNDGQAKN